MKAKLTKATVESLKADKSPLIVFDTEIPGLVLKVTPSGAKVFQLRYRMGGRLTPLKTFTLGRFGEALTVDQARRQVVVLKGQIKAGLDPAGEKKAREQVQRGARTIAAVSHDFLASHGRHLKTRSLVEYRNAFRLHIVPHLGIKTVRDLSRADVRRMHEGMAAYPVQANRTLQVLSAFMNWCIEGELRPESSGNPVSRVRRYSEEPRKRYLAPSEFAAIGDAIRNCFESQTIDPWQAGIFRCLLLTGMRRGELQFLRWEHVNFDRRVFALPDSKVGARDIPISAPALEVLTSLPRVTGNPFVFCGRVREKPVSNLFKAWARVLEAAGIEVNTRIHDLRHSFASVGVGSNLSLPIVGAILGHSKGATTERYSHLAQDPVAAATERIADQIARHLDGSPRDNVRVMRTR